MNIDEQILQIYQANANAVTQENSLELNPPPPPTGPVWVPITPMPSQNLTKKQKKHEDKNLMHLIKENETPSEAFLKSAKYEKVTSPLYDLADTIKL